LVFVGAVGFGQKSVSGLVDTEVGVNLGLYSLAVKKFDEVRETDVKFFCYF
jgi:hypothetical protein